MALDTEFDGTGDGPSLTRDFSSLANPFTFNIPNGDELDLRIEVKADGANEEVAFDSIQILGDSIPADQIFKESFETDGQGSRYTASPPFNDKAADFWDRGQNGDFVGASHDYLNPDGAYFWAARDTNAPDGNGNTVQTIDIDNVDISNVENLQFSGRFAASDRFGGAPPDDRILVQYRIDGGTFQDGLRFSPARINGPLAVDAKFDGLGEGTVLTHDFGRTANPFTFEIPPGNTLDLRIEVKADGPAEEVAFDSIRVLGDKMPTNVAFRESFETDGQGTRYTATQPFNDKANDFWTRGRQTPLDPEPNPPLPIPVVVASQVSNPVGETFWAAQDTNAPEGSGNATQTIDFTNIDISRFENIQFNGLFAASDRFGGFPRDDHILVQYRVDSGTFEDGLRFSPAGVNQPLALDTDFNGIGDGARLTHDLGSPDDPFMFFIPEGSTLDLRIEVKADGENEMVAMDSIKIIGDAMPTNRVFRESFESDGQGTRYTASTPFNDKKADYWNRGTNAEFFGLRDEYLNPSGANFWAARDTNAPEGNGNTVQTLEFNNIDVSRFEDLQFSGLFAAGSTRFA